jgi:hypothetical protein
MTLILQLLIAKPKYGQYNLFSKLNIQLIEIYCDDFICDKENNIIRYPSFDEKLDKKINFFSLNVRMMQLILLIM